MPAFAGMVDSTKGRSTSNRNRNGTESVFRALSGRGRRTVTHLKDNKEAIRDFTTHVLIPVYDGGKNNCNRYRLGYNRLSGLDIEAQEVFPWERSYWRRHRRSSPDRKGTLRHAQASYPFLGPLGLRLLADPAGQRRRLQPRASGAPFTNLGFRGPPAAGRSQHRFHRVDRIPGADHYLPGKGCSHILSRPTSGGSSPRLTFRCPCVRPPASTL